MSTPIVICGTKKAEVWRGKSKVGTVEGWENKKLSDLAEYINGYAFKPDDWEKEGLPIVRIEQLKNPHAPTDYYSGKLAAKNIIENGDLIFSWSASLFLRIWQNGRAALNQHLFRVVEKEGVDKVFLKLFIEFYLPELTNASHGSTMQHITRKELDRFNAPFPTSKPEQTKIAEILSTVDRAIEQTEALVAKQQRIKTGLMQDLLTRGIDEHGHLRSEQTHQFKDSPLGRIPVEWEVVQIEKTCSDIVDCPHSTPVYTDSGVPCIRTADMEPGHLLLATAFCVDEASFRERVLRLVPRTGDVIYSREGERLGIASPVGVDRVCLGQRVMLLRPDTKTDPDYLLWSMNAEDFYVRAVSGLGATTSPHINVKDIRKAQIKRPHTIEQKRIGKMLSMQHDQLRTNQGHLLKLSRLKTGLMQDLLTGKRRVTALLSNKEIANRRLEV
jgi:type I restriction enzyme, S subunit